jgi:hypothetical protein
MPGAAAQRARWVATTHARTAEEQRRPDEREDGLGELHLPDPRDPAAGQARVPGEEAEEHGEQGDVGEAEPGGDAHAGAGLGGDPGRGRDHDAQREGEDERPADGPGPAQVAREPAALGVAKRADDHGGEEQSVRGLDPARAAGGGEGHDGEEAGRGRQPERQGRALPRAQDGHHGGGGGQHRDHHGAVRGRQVAQRDRRQEGKADDHAEGDEDEAAPLGRGRARGAADHHHGEREQPCDRGAAEGHEPRVEVGHGQLRGGQGEGEREDPEGAEREPGREGRAARRRYRRRCDSVIYGTHA